MSNDLRNLKRRMRERQRKLLDPNWGSMRAVFPQDGATAFGPEYIVEFQRINARRLIPVAFVNLRGEPL